MFTSGPPKFTTAGLLDAVESVRQSGAGVLCGAFDESEVAMARRTILDRTHLMRNTRPSPMSRHLAGFHRFPSLEPLHQLITGNQMVREAMADLLGENFRTIGLTDITINRSQQWHKDLLRGRFSRHIDDDQPCKNHHGKLFKVILYLQDSTSLHIVPGSHRQDISLERDEFAIPANGEVVEQVKARIGDAVIIDICTTHRGSGEEAFQSLTSFDSARILVSTVFGARDCEFADRMELGNMERLLAWQRANS